MSNIQVVDGSIDFDDRPEHRLHKITELNVGIPFLSSCAIGSSPFSSASLVYRCAIIVAGTSTAICFFA